MRGHQGPSRVIKGHQGPSRAIKGHRGPSRAIKGHRGPSRAIKGHQGPSRAITCVMSDDPGFLRSKKVEGGASHERRTRVSALCTERMRMSGGTSSST